MTGDAPEDSAEDDEPTTTAPVGGYSRPLNRGDARDDGGSLGVTERQVGGTGQGVRAGTHHPGPTPSAGKPPAIAPACNCLPQEQKHDCSDNRGDPG